MSNWRYECPRGHVTVRKRGTGVNDGPYFQCESCRKAGLEYKHDWKRDKKTGRKITI